jgi:hypothetical protein
MRTLEACGSGDGCWDAFEASVQAGLPKADSADDGTITDALDLAIERYMECMDSGDLANDRQSCVDRLLKELNAGVPATQLSSDQQLEYAEALAELAECMQASSSVQQDFSCLRAFYEQAMTVMHLPVLAVKQQKRVFSAPHTIMRSCFHDATATLVACLKALHQNPTPTSAEERRKCLDEYHALLKTCSCLANNGPECLPKPQ